MRQNELMVGDWVKLDFYDVPYGDEEEAVWKNGKITAIHHGNWVDVDFGGPLDERDIEVEDVQPIPLTEEILKKNGFKDISDHTLKGCDTFRLNVEQRGFDYRVTVKLKDYFKLQSYDDRWYTLCEMEFGCNYVHQLQHALKLCGIDKEIVL